jgi:hypothetical protein
MNQLLITMCLYTSSYNTACQKTLTTAYDYSDVKTVIEHEQRHYEKLGNTLLEEYNLRPLTGVIAVCSELTRRDITLPLTSGISAKYINKDYVITGSWSF